MQIHRGALGEVLSYVRDASTARLDVDCDGEQLGHDEWVSCETDTAVTARGTQRVGVSGMEGNTEGCSAGG